MMAKNLPASVAPHVAVLKGEVATCRPTFRTDNAESATPLMVMALGTETKAMLGANVDTEAEGG